MTTQPASESQTIRGHTGTHRGAVVYQDETDWDLKRAKPSGFFFAIELRFEASLLRTAVYNQSTPSRHHCRDTSAGNLYPHALPDST